MGGLTYDEVRHVVQDGDIIFIHGLWSSPIQALIMFFTGSEFSHCVIAFWVETPSGKRLMCVEAQGMTRRRILSLNFYSDTLMTVVQAPIQWKLVQDVALGEVGKKRYGLLQATYVGICEYVYRHTGKQLPHINLHHEICSEFIANVYKLPERHVSPQRLFEQLTQ